MLLLTLAFSLASLSNDPMTSIDLASFPSTALHASLAAHAHLENEYRVRRDGGDGDIFSSDGLHAPEVNTAMEIPKRKHKKKMKLPPEAQP